MEPSTCWCSSTLGRSRMRASSASSSDGIVALTSGRRAYIAGPCSAQDRGRDLDLDPAIADGIGRVRHHERAAALGDDEEALADRAQGEGLGVGRGIIDVALEAEAQVEPPVLED